jgi:hypothetical protein
MANAKISELPASGALTGAELVELVQGGVNKQTTAQDIADLGSGGGGAVDSVNGQTGVVVLDAGDIAFTPTGTIAATDVQSAIAEVASEAGSSAWGSITGTLSAQTDLDTALGLKAPLASPTFTGTPAAPTAAPGTNTTQLATTAFVAAAVTGGSIADGDKGEITVASSGTVWTIDNGVVTAAKLASAVDPIGVQDIWVSAEAMSPRITAGCSALTQIEMATSIINLHVLGFDQTTQEFAQFRVVLPRKWNIGTVTVVPYWTATSGSGTVQWGISGGAYSNDDALTVALGTAQTSDDTLIATNDLHVGSETSAITLAGTPADADFLVFQISRNVASDTLSADALLIGISVRITTDAAKDA